MPLTAIAGQFAAGDTSVGFGPTQKTFAEERSGVPDMLLAQINPVLCQRRLGQGRILRRIQLPRGTCIDEVINTFTGEVVERRDVPCDSNC